MRHGIALFDETDSEGWGMAWLLSGLLAVISLTFFVVTGALPWLAGPAQLALLSYGIFGHHFWPLDSSDIARWARYQKLPAEQRKAIGMTRKEFANMTDAQRGEVSIAINNIEQVLANRSDNKVMPAELRARFSAVLESEKSAYKHEQEVKNKMKELGWDE